MKRNITINMQGRLYAIDEDAYDLLKQYEDSLREYFHRQDGGDEIVDDIEARIAELFDEVKASGKAAIDIGDVQRIITRIGNPQQMDGGETDSNVGESGTGGNADGEGQPTVEEKPSSFFDRVKKFFIRKDRRLYRDPKDKKVLGVLSGLAHYYGGDVTMWRVCAVLLGVLFLTMPGNWDNLAFYELILYFILGMVLPQAVTPEDRLRMNGKAVDPQNIAKEVTSEGKEDGSRQAGAANPDGSQQRGCLSMFGDVVVALIKIVMWFIFGVIILTFISLLAGLLLLLFVPSLQIFTDSGIMFSWPGHPWVGTIGIVSFSLLIILIIYSFISRNKRQTTTTAGKVAFIILLVASLVGSITSATIIISDLRKQVENFDISLSSSETQRHTHNGTYMEDSDWNYLNSGGWKILQHDNCHDHYTASGKYYTGNEDKRYLDSYDESGQQLYRAERVDSTITPGAYSLSAVVRSDGTGAYIYAIADGKTYKMEIPAEGGTGGGIWQEAKVETSSEPDDSTAVGKQKLIREIANANNGNGYGWSRITINGIKTKTGRIKYGMTSVPEITGDQFAGTWFSATDFKLTRE